MTGSGVRQRIKNHKKSSLPELQPHAQSKTQFVPRDSLLTQLLTTSGHIRAIYHIFLVILAMLFLDTVLYDFFQHGKIDAGVGTVLAGFGDVKRAARLWLFELMVAMTFLPGLHFYGAVYRMLRPHMDSSQILTQPQCYSLFSRAYRACHRFILMRNKIPYLTLSLRREVHLWKVAVTKTRSTSISVTLKYVAVNNN
ncbi:Sterol O-acyltransferase 1 [Eumeta japonica]|uniref:Sterol O-acyltransferase 1 n=1 Tax=Eumeta variegata TaxID=151549 RepID=A0A4C1U6B5_EUMVA|nr:Sterol O-acyltransferase 1 [Eumeta japonica]